MLLVVTTRSTSIGPARGRGGGQIYGAKKEKERRHALSGYDKQPQVFGISCIGILILELATASRCCFLAIRGRGEGGRGAGFIFDFYLFYGQYDQLQASKQSKANIFSQQRKAKIILFFWNINDSKITHIVT